MKKLYILILWILLFPIANLFAETQVSGNITANTTWTLANSPYIVTGTIQVYPEATLTIEPGVEIRFNKDAGLQIGGGLIAIGEENNIIKFTSDISFERIAFVDSTLKLEVDDGFNYLSGNIIKYCTIEHAEFIICKKSSVYISNNNIQTEIGIDTSNAISVIIRDNTITGTRGQFSLSGGFHLIKNNKFLCNSLSVFINDCNFIFEGHLIENSFFNLSTSHASGKIINNIFRNNRNGSGSVMFPISGNIEMYYCSITSNIIESSSSVIYIDDQFSRGSYNFQYNNIFGNNSNSSLYELNNPYNNAVTAINNWWGTTDTSIIDQKIFDYYDEFTRGKVTYVSYRAPVNNQGPIFSE